MKNALTLLCFSIIAPCSIIAMQKNENTRSMQDRKALYNELNEHANALVEGCERTNKKLDELSENLNKMHETVALIKKELFLNETANDNEPIQLAQTNAKAKEALLSSRVLIGLGGFVAVSSLTAGIVYYMWHTKK